MMKTLGSRFWIDVGNSLSSLLVLVGWATSSMAAADGGPERKLVLPPGPGNPRNSEGDVNNDRAVQLAGGRLVLPLALHNLAEYDKPDWAGRIMCYLSDDNGKTWRRGTTNQMRGQSTKRDRPGGLPSHAVQPGLALQGIAAVSMDGDLSGV